MSSHRCALPLINNPATENPSLSKDYKLGALDRKNEQIAKKGPAKSIAGPVLVGGVKCPAQYQRRTRHSGYQNPGRKQAVAAKVQITRAVI